MTVSSVVVAGGGVACAAGGATSIRAYGMKTRVPAGSPACSLESSISKALFDVAAGSGAITYPQLPMRIGWPAASVAGCPETTSPETAAAPPVRSSVAERAVTAPSKSEMSRTCAEPPVGCASVQVVSSESADAVSTEPSAG